MALEYTVTTSHTMEVEIVAKTADAAKALVEAAMRKCEDNPNALADKYDSEWEVSDLLPMAKARGIPPLGRTPNALPAPQAPAYIPMAKARGITQDLVMRSRAGRGARARYGISCRPTAGRRGLLRRVGRGRYVGA